MRSICSLFIVLLFCFPCKNSPEEISLDKKTSIKKEINSTLTNWHKAASKADFQNYFDAMDSASVFIGTDASENWSKKQFADFSKPYFDKGKAWTFKTLERNVFISKTGDFVWFDELLDTWMGTCRGSGVLEKKSNGWKIKHYVLSVAIPNNDVQAVISAKKKNDSIFLNKFN